MPTKSQIRFGDYVIQKPYVKTMVTQMLVIDISNDEAEVAFLDKEFHVHFVWVRKSLLHI